MRELDSKRFKVLINKAREEFAHYEYSKNELQRLLSGELEYKPALVVTRRIEYLQKMLPVIERIRSVLSPEQLLFLQVYADGNCKKTLKQTADETGLELAQLRKWEKEIFYSYIHEMGWG